MLNSLVLLASMVSVQAQPQVEPQVQFSNSYEVEEALGALPCVEKADYGHFWGPLVEVEVRTDFDVKECQETALKLVPNSKIVYELNDFFIIEFSL